MSSFVLLAGLMLVAALLVMLLPMLRTAREQDGPTRAGTIAAIVVSAVLVPVVAIEMYRNVSTWDWHSPLASGTEVPGTEGHSANMDEMAAGLRARLEANPQDLEGWLMLSRTYLISGRFEDALDSMRRARELPGGQTPMVAAQYAEALALADQQKLMTEAGPIFEEVLEAAPDDQRALFYGGLYAYQQDRLEVARARWERLQALAPPESIRPIIEQRLALVYERLGAGPAGTAIADTTAAAPAVSVAGSSPAAGPAESAGSNAAVAAGVPATGSTEADNVRGSGPEESGVIGLKVSLADGVGAGRDLSRAVVFIFARRAEGGGPPLAAVRRPAAELPLTIELSDANAMMAGMSLTDVPELKLVARVSLAGGPAAASGDIQGETLFRWGGRNVVDLVIDKVIP